MLMAIAEKAGIEPVIDADDDDDTDEIEAVDLEEQSKNMIGEGGRFQDAKVRNIQPMSVGRDIKEQLENLDGAKLRASLLEKREPKERTSLLEK
jgi:hypothetical protein